MREPGEREKGTRCGNRAKGVRSTPGAFLRASNAVLFVRLAVRVHLGRLRVRVAEPVLERPQRRAGGRHACSERVPELMEGDLCDAGPLQRLLEASDELGAIEGP